MTMEEPGTGVVCDETDSYRVCTYNPGYFLVRNPFPYALRSSLTGGSYNVAARWVDVVGRPSGTLDDIKGMAAMRKARIELGVSVRSDGGE